MDHMRQRQQQQQQVSLKYMEEKKKFAFDVLFLFKMQYTIHTHNSFILSFIYGGMIIVSYDDDRHYVCGGRNSAKKNTD